MMRIWILRPIKEDDGAWVPWYDKAFGFVVCAKDIEEARKIASDDHGDEGREAWMDPKQSTCIELTPGEKSRVVVQNFHSA